MKLLAMIARALPLSILKTFIIYFIEMNRLHFMTTTSKKNSNKTLNLLSNEFCLCRKRNHNKTKTAWMKDDYQCKWHRFFFLFLFLQHETNIKTRTCEVLLAIVQKIHEVKHTTVNFTKSLLLLNTNFMNEKVRKICIENFSKKKRKCNLKSYAFFFCKSMFHFTNSLFVFDRIFVHLTNKPSLWLLDIYFSYTFIFVHFRCCYFGWLVFF